VYLWLSGITMSAVGPKSYKVDRSIVLVPQRFACASSWVIHTYAFGPVPLRITS
jgi:hypothetical protein